VATTISIGDDWPTGFYLLIIRVERGGRVIEREHFFVLRETTQTASIALVLSTATLLAYNDWGGANSYRGLVDTHPDVGTPYQSMLRPIARGFLRKPPGAPRARVEEAAVPIGWVPRYGDYEWARHQDYSRSHACSFWATYEREFVLWAEREGIELAYLTQHDLHFDPHALDGYACLVVVGHDEYHSWEMRDAFETFLERGGNIARFGGNYLWQVRYEDDGATQVCFKRAEADPVWDTDQARSVSTRWDHPAIGRPVAHTMGLTGSAGVYHRFGTAVPRGAGGFTIYRPEHWSFEGTDLYYGDVLGGAPSYIAAFEVDGLDYTFRGGVPYPTGTDGAPEDMEVLGLVPASSFEEDRWNAQVRLGDAGEAQIFPELEGSYFHTRPDGSVQPGYGCGAIACLQRGTGTLYNAGASEWVAGLLHRDPFVEQVTRNVLRRLSGNTKEHR
jgi:hypothetical protein